MLRRYGVWRGVFRYIVSFTGIFLPHADLALFCLRNCETVLGSIFVACQKRYKRTLYTSNFFIFTAVGKKVGGAEELRHLTLVWGRNECYRALQGSY